MRRGLLRGVETSLWLSSVEGGVEPPPPPPPPPPPRPHPNPRRGCLPPRLGLPPNPPQGCFPPTVGRLGPGLGLPLPAK